MWIKNTSNKKDAILTLTIIGFLIIMVKLLLAGSTLVINGDTYTFGEIDASIIAAVLTPTLGAYVARRYTTNKFDGDVEYFDEE